MEIFFSSTEKIITAVIRMKMKMIHDLINENDITHPSDMFVYLGFYIICNKILYIEYPSIHMVTISDFIMMIMKSTYSD